ncbi:VWA domain-containing protein [Viridibacillus sp. YIM B01967]|uniref:VWA domain-containing protein n=1 Tax=Viridibacillus soli TaxID=2798301 RepID=A0ABS1H3G9_9BACL|nr:VWA domain-containing protein [Viridibacillus soli]MBK3493955.1 VWA domain-containing protein [Viridibacillus soli]
MSQMNRFIQFNNEQINARQMLHYEQLTRALSHAPYLSLTERQVLELRPKEQALSMSVFWRHREKEIMHAGRLSDIYLLAAGFWRYFSVQPFLELLEELQGEAYAHLFEQLVLMAEEFRLMDAVEKGRPGTAEAFQIRRQVYVDYHKQQLQVNLQKGFLADATLNYLFVMAHEGSMQLDTSSMPAFFDQLLYPWQSLYDVRSTEDSITLVYRMMTMIVEHLDKDLMHTYYAVMDSLVEAAKFNEHKGVTEQEQGDKDEAKETIEELFRTWHRESQSDEGVHMRYELEHGNEGKAMSTEAEEGREGAEISEVGIGGAQDQKDSVQQDDSDEVKKLPPEKKRAGKYFGEEHRNVVYEERRIETVRERESMDELVFWRTAQEPYVKALMAEFRKRMAQKEIARRDHLTKGRLSSKLTTFLIDERPKPFYKKNAPAKPLDAVFGLLVDGSASMIDKMDETKQAVLLFHDVLRKMGITHEIVSFYEDAYEASEEKQPNTFEWVHKLEDGAKDSGSAIMALEAHEDNRDGFAIRWLIKRLAARDEKHRFLLVFSDGEPSAFGYAQNGIVDTAEAVMEAEKKGIHVMHLFLNTDMPTEEQLQLFRMIYGPQSVAADSVEKFTDVTLRLLRKMIGLVIQSG